MVAHRPVSPSVIYSGEKMLHDNIQVNFSVAIPRGPGGDLSVRIII